MIYDFWKRETIVKPAAKIDDGVILTPASYHTYHPHFSVNFDVITDGWKQHFVSQAILRLRNYVTKANFLASDFNSNTRNKDMWNKAGFPELQQGSDNSQNPDMKTSFFYPPPEVSDIYDNEKGREYYKFDLGMSHHDHIGVEIVDTKEYLPGYLASDEFRTRFGKEKVGTTNAASAAAPGGGAVRKGGGSQEESYGQISDLMYSLIAQNTNNIVEQINAGKLGWFAQSLIIGVTGFGKLALRKEILDSGNNWQNYIPVVFSRHFPPLGGIKSQNVRIYDNANPGSEKKLTIYSFALPNLSGHINDAPVEWFQNSGGSHVHSDIPSDAQWVKKHDMTLEAYVKSNFRSMVCTAIEDGITVLIFSNIGAGIYHGPPEEYGKWFAEVLQEKISRNPRMLFQYFKNIVLVRTARDQKTTSETTSVYNYENTKISDSDSADTKLANAFANAMRAVSLPERTPPHRDLFPMSWFEGTGYADNLEYIKTFVFNAQKNRFLHGTNKKNPVQSAFEYPSPLSLKQLPKKAGKTIEFNILNQPDIVIKAAPILSSLKEIEKLHPNVQFAVVNAPNRYCTCFDPKNPNKLLKRLYTQLENELCSETNLRTAIEGSIADSLWKPTDGNALKEWVVSSTLIGIEENSHFNVNPKLKIKTKSGRRIAEQITPYIKDSSVLISEGIQYYNSKKGDNNFQFMVISPAFPNSFPDNNHADRQDHELWKNYKRIPTDIFLADEPLSAKEKPVWFRKHAMTYKQYVERTVRSIVYGAIGKGVKVLVFPSSIFRRGDNERNPFRLDPVVFGKAFGKVFLEEFNFKTPGRVTGFYKENGYAHEYFDAVYCIADKQSEPGGSSPDYEFEEAFRNSLLSVSQEKFVLNTILASSMPMDTSFLEELEI